MIRTTQRWARAAVSPVGVLGATAAQPPHTCGKVTAGRRDDEAVLVGQDAPGVDVPVKVSGDDSKVRNELRSIGRILECGVCVTVSV
jgi:hypothetical protein